MRITNWDRNDTLAEEIINQEDVKGWYNEEADEAVVRASYEKSMYVAYFYINPDRSSRASRKRTGRVLFRDSSKSRIDSRIAEQLRNYPEDIDFKEVRREEMESPRNLSEWAHVYGAANAITEKIGNCKESGGEVAIFDGSVRWGEGAYVAIAEEDGPRGKEYVSIGSETNGFYKVIGANPRRGPVEIMEPEGIDFFANGEIIITNSEGDQVKVVPTDKGRESEAWRDMF